jgi:tetratricopeptide (TPR) repeat protein
MSPRFRPAILALIALAFATSPAVAATPVEPAQRAAAWRELQAGVNRGDAAALLAAQQAFVDLSEADPSSEQLHCGAALAGWRVAPLLTRSEATQPQARQALTEGLAHCDAVLLKHPNHALALALKGSLQSLLIGLEPASTMTLGPQSAAGLKRAAGLAPADPRVQLLQAIYTLHMPAAFGGGADKAMPVFSRAIELFAAEAPGDSTAPAWGRDDALLWAGKAAEKLGRAQEAHDYYRKALAVNPSNGWARNLLKDVPAGGKP